MTKADRIETPPSAPVSRRFGQMPLLAEGLLLFAGVMVTLMVDITAMSLGLSSMNPTGAIFVIMALGRLAIVGLAAAIRSIGLITGVAIWTTVVIVIYGSLPHHPV